MALPGLQARSGAIAQLPALGLLTLAGLNPSDWSASYHESAGADGEALSDRIIELRPDLVAVSALTASIEEAYRFSSRRAACGREGRPRRTARDGLPGRGRSARRRRGRGATGEPTWPTVLADAECGSLRPVYHAATPFDPDRGTDPPVRLAGPGAPPSLHTPNPARLSPGVRLLRRKPITRPLAREAGREGRRRTGYDPGDRAAPGRRTGRRQHPSRAVARSAPCWTPSPAPACATSPSATGESASSPKSLRPWRLRVACKSSSGWNRSTCDTSAWDPREPPSRE